MMTRYAAYLNGKGLAEIDPEIMILDIAYFAPRYQDYTSAKGKYDGTLMQGRRAQSTSVTITFEIHEQDIARRRDICQRVQAWAAKGGYLKTNDRPGQRLRVVCDSPTVISSALRWTQKLSVTFTAYEQPFWEDEYPRTATVERGKSGAIFVRGTAEKAFVTAEVKNTGDETINTLTLSAGDTRFAFEDLDLPAGETLTIDYDEKNRLRIYALDTSKMSKRTADSSDDLMLYCGARGVVSITADGSAQATFRARGLYI